MPVLSRLIRMYFQQSEHNPPHLHAIYGEHVTAIDFQEKKKLKVNCLKAETKNFDKFQNEGYKVLYNGETADDIAKRKGLRHREDILDNMGNDELIANLFRI